MQVERFHWANLQPMSAVYAADSDIKFQDVREYTHEGIDFIFPTALSALECTTTNNHTNIYLSEKKSSHNILKGITSKPLYPVYRSTYLRARDTDAFWVTDSSTGTTVISGVSSLADNRYYYELEILSPSYVAIRHFDGTNLKYLTLNQTTSSALSFQTRSEETLSGADYDTQIFKYILNDDTNELSLFSSILSGDSTVADDVLVNPSVIRGVSSSLSASPVSKTWTANANEVFLIRPSTAVSNALNLESTWNSYVSAIEENTLKVNANKSIAVVNNNYILHTATNSLSTDMSVDILPLKNQLTVGNKQSRNNPYSSSETEVDHRSYHTIDTGSYQRTGYESMLLNYTAGVTDIKFPVNELTYFNLPPTIAPYSALNVNDAKFPECGAIWADSPIKSDKVFKKLVDRNEDVVLDNKDGTFLCSWLSGNSDAAVTPIWVDRYYNPHFVTYTQAITSGTIKPREIENSFRTITQKLSAESQYIYDKHSDVVFEPNSLYAYYHIGNRDCEQLIDRLKSDVVVDGILSYVDYNHAPVAATYDAEYQDTHVMSSGVKMTGRHHSSSNIIMVPPVYTFNRDNYGISTVPSNINGSFTVSLWIHNTDWTKPFANQFAGTYTNNGFGLFNEPFITPFITALDGDKVHTFNSDYKYLNTHFNSVTARCITRRGSVENYWVVDNTNTIYEYDMTGVVQNKIDTSSLLSNKTVTDIEIDEDYIYLALENESSYYRYDLSNQAGTYYGELVSAHIWNEGATTSSSTTASRIHSTYYGISGSTDGNGNWSRSVVLTCPDRQLSQGSVIDNYGNPWVIQDNILYTYDTSISATIPAVSGSSDQSLEAVNCDRSGNIWLLHGSNKVAKFNTNRELLFNVSLSSTPLPSTRMIDFIHEFGDNGYVEYATVLNQSVSGAKGINVSTDGTFRSEFSVLTGTVDPAQDLVTHFKTPLSSSDTVYHSWKTITGFDYMRRTKAAPESRIDAKLSLTNLYNSSTTTAAFSGFTLSYNLSGLQRGWHHIGVVLDAELGDYSMYIDAVKVSSITLPATKFSFSEVFNQPIIIGGTPFYNNILLSEAISQPKQYLADNIKIKNFKVYDTALQYFDLRSHYLLHANIHDVTWQIPSGQRNYVDTIERVFKHKLPGRRSERFDVSIKGLGLTDDALKQEIQAAIQSEINRTSPIYTKLNTLGWDSGSSVVSGSLIDKSNSTIGSSAGATNTSQSSYGS